MNTDTQKLVAQLIVNFLKLVAIEFSEKREIGIDSIFWKIFTVKLSNGEKDMKDQLHKNGRFRSFEYVGDEGEYLFIAFKIYFGKSGESISVFHTNMPDILSELEQ